MARARYTRSVEAVERLVEMIRAAAVAGLVCPKNAELCGRLGCSSASRPAEMLKRAELLGLVRVQRGQSTRIVEAADGSWRTAGALDHVHWRERGTASAAAAAALVGPRPKRTRQRLKVGAAGVAEAQARSAAMLRAPKAAPAEAAPVPMSQPAGTPPPAEPRVAPSVPAAASWHVSAPPPLFRTCQWPSGDPRAPGFRFCGDPNVVPGRPYCAAHCARAFERRPPRAEAA